MKDLENTVGKQENAGYQHFLLFQHCFLLRLTREIIVLATFHWLSANASNLVKDKILLLRRVNPLPDDKVLDWSKLKQIADDISMGECNTILSAYTMYRHLG